ncbi:hypothetical protein B0H19DRAFT_1199535 [Mycena capillaripes]|nr:hypothetical protein B0H19DRAFT_1203757 [Mycena capillaripes]KAJ6525216.1 hypothetical protein B0H19DRAFT_1199535 [Mycena capillaripes]
MGNSEVGASVHRRRMWQDTVHIDVAFKKRVLNETILASHKRAKDGKLHLLGPMCRSRRRRAVRARVLQAPLR